MDRYRDRAMFTRGDDWIDRRSKRPHRRFTPHAAKGSDMFPRFRKNAVVTQELMKEIMNHFPKR